MILPYPLCLFDIYCRVILSILFVFQIHFHYIHCISVSTRLSTKLWITIHWYSIYYNSYCLLSTLQVSFFLLISFLLVYIWFKITIYTHWLLIVCYWQLIYCRVIHRFACIVDKWCFRLCYEHVEIVFIDTQDALMARTYVVLMCCLLC